MTVKLVWLSLLLASCGGRAATESGNASPSRGGTSNVSAGGAASTAGTASTASNGAAAGGNGAIIIGVDDGGTTVTFIPDDAGPDPSTQLIHPGGPLGECDSVPCEPGLTCIEPWPEYYPGYHVCSFKCAKPESPSTLDPTLKAQCEIRYAGCRLENPADLQCIPQEPETP
jgi:hypothetical protein